MAGAERNTDAAVCVCCRLSGETCAVRYLEGVCEAWTDAPGGAGTLTLRAADGRAHAVQYPAEAGPAQPARLISRARALAEAAGRPLRIGLFHLAAEPDGAWRHTANSLTILEPDWLISVSDATGIGFCDRRRLISFFETDPANLPLIRGTLVHAVFPLIWKGCAEDDLRVALRLGAAGQAVKIGLAGLTVAAVEKDAWPHALRMKRWADGMRKESALVTETFRLAPGLGLKGRIDAVWERPGLGPVIVGELKTGRSRGRAAAHVETAGGSVEAGHLFQLASYAAMLHARGEVRAATLHAFLLYSGNEGTANGRPDLMRTAALNPAVLRETADVRNRLVLMEMGAVPRVKGNPAACARCRGRAACEAVGELTGADEPGARAAVFTEPERVFFRHFSEGIRTELTAVRADMARLWRTEPAARVAAGRALRLAGPCSATPDEEAGEAAGPGVSWWRTAGENHSEFRAGDAVLLSEAGGPATGRTALGFVAASGAAIVGLTGEWGADFAPVWVDGYPDEKLVRRAWAALFRFMARPSGVKAVLVNAAHAPRFGAAPPDWESALRPAVRAWLAANPAPRDAVERALRAEDYLLVTGPPGAGKTTLIGVMAEAILAVHPRARVLVAAATNRALDQALERIVPLAEAGVPVARLGSEETASAAVREWTPAVRARRAGSVEAACAEAARTVRDARLVGITASSLAGGVYEGVLGEFDWVVLDEASQMTVPLAAGAASYGRRLILIGDDRQLPPIARGADPGAWDGTGRPPLSVSLFEWLKRANRGGGAERVDLENQFRMSAAVCAAPAALWYAGALRPGAAHVADRRLTGLAGRGVRTRLNGALNPARPVLLVDVPGETRPRVCEAEARWTADFVGALRACGAEPMAPEEAGAALTLAVISPYRAQVARIRSELTARWPEARARWRACVDTVDRFQGGEADVVVVSLCPPAEGESAHLADERRLNVALTRARAKLVVLGEAARLERHAVFRRLFAEWEARWPGGAWRIAGARLHSGGSASTQAAHG